MEAEGRTSERRAGAGSAIRYCCTTKVHQNDDLAGYMKYNSGKLEESRDMEFVRRFRFHRDLLNIFGERFGRVVGSWKKKNSLSRCTANTVYG